MTHSKIQNPKSKIDGAALLKRALAAARRAYAPYSGLRVGAALLATDGRVFTGCNVENASYGLTVCAERAALFRAVAEGARRFRAIAVASPAMKDITPCGACLQVMAEFAPRLVVYTGTPGRPAATPLPKLLPRPFPLRV